MFLVKVKDKRHKAQGTRQKTKGPIFRLSPFAFYLEPILLIVFTAGAAVGFGRAGRCRGFARHIFLGAALKVGFVPAGAF